MALVERTAQLQALEDAYDNILTEGRSVFVSGEAGIGKTSLVNAFCRGRKRVLKGTCDALYSPRPLAPLYDVVWQLNEEAPTQRFELFAWTYQQLAGLPATILVFEDVHWADAATLDFIKFLGRRIGNLRVLFILTFREDETDARHPLRSVLGQLAPTRIHLAPLSKATVDRMAGDDGHVYRVTGGNPFFVNELLHSDNQRIPANVKDAVLEVYNRQDEATRAAWDRLSILPSGSKDELPASPHLIQKNGRTSFKHELFRLAIEEALPEGRKRALHREAIGRLIAEDDVEQIVHHAQRLGDRALVARYAPRAAERAGLLGAHTEAAKLRLTAIEFSDEPTPGFFEAYAYECYLTNHFKEAIDYQSRALALRRQGAPESPAGQGTPESPAGQETPESLADCMRFLSRLYWFDGNREQAEHYGGAAVSALESRPPSRIQAMTFSNMAQLHMLAERMDDCVYWGERAIALATGENDREVLAHALNNVASAIMRKDLENGAHMMRRSLEIALAGGYHEHAARAYTNLSCQYIGYRAYDAARAVLDEGIRYCEARDLDAWNRYMTSWKARLELETGHWAEATRLSEGLLVDPNMTLLVRLTALTVKGTVFMRQGAGARAILEEAHALALKTREPERIAMTAAALLEYEWLYGDVLFHEQCSYDSPHYNEWLYRARGGVKPAITWHTPYEQAFTADRAAAVNLLAALGATQTLTRLKQEWRREGDKKIPRGPRATTDLLTGRERDVLRLLKEGMQNKEIAGKLFISAKTVDHHISNILAKLDVNSRGKAVEAASRLGLLPAAPDGYSTRTRPQW